MIRAVDAQMADTERFARVAFGLAAIERQAEIAGVAVTLEHYRDLAVEHGAQVVSAVLRIQSELQLGMANELILHLAQRGNAS